MLTAERLRQILSYNCETGEFTWLVRCGPRARKARIAAELMIFGRFARQQPHGS